MVDAVAGGDSDGLWARLDTDSNGNVDRFEFHKFFLDIKRKKGGKYLLFFLEQLFRAQGIHVQASDSELRVTTQRSVSNVIAA